jgi:hypothetical protein
MYLLKHIYTHVHSVINHLIVALVLTTCAYLFSSAYAGTTSQPVLLRVAITANNGHVNTNFFYYSIDKNNVSAGFIQPLSLHICNALRMNETGVGIGNTNLMGAYPTIR